MKKLLSTLFLLLSTQTAFAADNPAAVSSLEELAVESPVPLGMRALYPDLRGASPDAIEVLTQFDGSVGIKEVKKLDNAELYSVVTKTNEVAYLTTSGAYLVTGDVIDLKKNFNLTKAKKAELDKIDWRSLPWDLAFSTGPTDATYEVAVFTDVDCPYCRKLEKSLKLMPDVRVHYFLYPIEKLHPQAVSISNNLVCSSDPAAAMHRYIFEGVMPEAADPSRAEACSQRVARLVDFARSQGISGTPTLVLPTGHRFQGAPQNDADIRKLLAQHKN